jgi:hypothetical protein
LKFELKFLFSNFEKKWPYHHREMEKIEKKSILKFEKKSVIPPEGNEKK